MATDLSDKIVSGPIGKYLSGAVAPFAGIQLLSHSDDAWNFSMAAKPLGFIAVATIGFIVAFLVSAIMKGIFIKADERDFDNRGVLENFLAFLLIASLSPIVYFIVLSVAFPDFKSYQDGLSEGNKIRMYFLFPFILSGIALTHPVHKISRRIVSFNIYGEQENDLFSLSETDKKNDPWADDQRLEKWLLFSVHFPKKSHLCGTNDYFRVLTKYQPDFLPDKLKQENYQRLAPFVEFLCAVHGRFAREALNHYTEQQAEKDHWPEAFFQRYPFGSLKEADLDAVPFDAVQTFLLGVFGDLYRITPNDLQLTPAEIREQIRADVVKQHQDNNNRRQQGFPMLPVHERPPVHILRRHFNFVLGQKQSLYYQDFRNMVERLERTYDREALSGMAFDEKHLVFGIPPEDDRAKLYPARSAYDCAVSYGDPINRHVYIIGKTGSGKTTLLQTLIAQHIENEQGLVILSPENALFDNVLAAIPPERARDVVYFDPTAMESPLVSLSPFTIEPGELIFERMGEVYAVLEAALGELGDSMKALLNKCVYTLLQRPGSTLQDLNRLLKPAPDFRRAIIADTRIDEETREWWRDTYEGKGSKLPLSAEAILRRLDAFFMPPLSLTISRASFSLTDALNAQKSIFLFNLSRLKGLQAEVMGQLVISSVLQALLARDKQSSSTHLPYHFIIDEFQTYAGTSSKAFIDMFNRARKYRMSMTLAHQVTENIPQELLATIIGNAGTKIIMERPSTDAPFFAKELQLKVPDKDTFNAPVLQNLQAHEFFIQTPNNKKGVILKTMFDLYEPISLPIKAKELPKGYQDAAIEDLDDWRRLLKTISRQHYGKPIEAAARAQPTPPSDHPNPKPSQSQDDPDEDDFAVT
jgi:energy-coupling factor transporter ATP-binding protein EcfA2